MVSSGPGSVKYVAIWVVLGTVPVPPLESRINLKCFFLGMLNPFLMFSFFFKFCFNPNYCHSCLFRYFSEYFPELFPKCDEMLYPGLVWWLFSWECSSSFLAVTVLWRPRTGRVWSVLLFQSGMLSLAANIDAASQNEGFCLPLPLPLKSPSELCFISEITPGLCNPLGRLIKVFHNYNLYVLAKLNKFTYMKKSKFR